MYIYKIHYKLTYPGDKDDYMQSGDMTVLAPSPEIAEAAVESNFKHNKGATLELRRESPNSLIISHDCTYSGPKRK